ncbi:MAG: FAD-dependent monooxygenase [Burkholderiaceae bacterium]|jgi:ubiquinone biosynthesis UbiH/UbiF/VisC/COQ6 family hydroxylase|nr:FAD-dependent monooxygenase [Burkholderiaceae bacterium]
MSSAFDASRTFDVAVIGAGVAGLATALGLAQHGLRVALVGPMARRHVPTAEAPFDARIYALSAGSIDLLARLKVWAQVDATRLQAVSRMRVFGDDGDELSFDAYGAQVARLATIGEEGELLRVLTLGAGFAPGLVRITAGMRALQVDARAATVTLDDGSLLQAALVIGADGANSALRAAAGISAQEQPYPHTAVVANFGTERPHDGVAWQWFCGEGVVALLPLPGRAVSLVWSAPHGLADELRAMSAGELAARVTARSGGVLGALVAQGQAHGFPLRRLTVDRLVVPRVALVGDAAHVVHPLAGQGLNLGLQDVSTLLDVIKARESWRDPGDLVLLRRYARARAEPIGLIRFTTDSLARLFAVDDPVLRSVRNRGLAWVNRTGPLKRALIRHALG